MAQIPLTNMSLLSADKATAGTQMTEQFASMAHPLASQCREEFVLRSRTHNTPTLQELFIDGLQNYRFKGINDSTVALRGQVAYNSNVTANCAVFDVALAVRVTNNVATLIGTPTITKFGASVATLIVAVNATPACVVFNAAGVAGDTVANWIGSINITESTDFVS